MITYRINQNTQVGKTLMGLAALLQNPDDLLYVLAREGNNRLRTWFRQRDEDSPNQLGGERTHFWQQMADSVSSRRGGAGQLVLSITDPRFNQKVFGGTIVPKNKKALTIPVNPAAYGRTASTYEQQTGQKLFVVIWKGGKGSIGALCVKSDPSQKFLEVVYLLVGAVHQDADPNALPPARDFYMGLIDRAKSYVGRMTNQDLSGPTAPPTP